jgi:hypothetical protein
MARQDVDISSFVGGEISPYAKGRIDEDKWYSSADTMQNMVVLAQGGMTKRPGTLYATNSKNQTQPSRLKRFIFSTQQAYMLEFGAGFCRVMADRAPVLNQVTVTNATNVGGNICLTLSSASGLYTNNVAEVAGVNGVPANGQWTISNVTDSIGAIGTSNGPNGSTLLYTNGALPNWDPAQPVTVSGCDGTMDVNGTWPWIAWPAGGTNCLLLNGSIFGGTPPTVGTVSGNDANQIILNGSTFSGAYTSGGTLTAYVEVPTPYQQGDLASLYFFQSDDQLFICHPNYPPASINRYSNTLWTYTPLVFYDGPYLDPVVTNLPVLQGSGVQTTTTMHFDGPPTGGEYWNPNISVPGSQPAGYITVQDITAGLVEVDASSTVGINPLGSNPGRGFLSSDVGRLMRAQTIGNTAIYWYWYRIRQVNSPTQVMAAMQGMVANGAFLGNYQAAGTFLGQTVKNYLANIWQLGKWSATTGYPWVGALFQQRMVLCGTNNQPNAIEGSVEGDYFNFAPTQSAPFDATASANDASAFSFIVADNEVNGVRWVGPVGAAQLAQLGIGTQGGEIIIQSGDNQQALSALSVQAYAETKYGSIANVEPQRIGKCLLFAGLNGRKVHEWQYAWQNFGYLGPDLTVWAEHITLVNKGGGMTGIAQMIYQQHPHSIVWAILSNGALIGMTYQKDQNVIAWHRHRLGGSYYGGAAMVESIDVIPSQDGTYSELWLEVARTNSAGVVRTIEVMTVYFEGMQRDQAVYLDCAVQTALTYPAAGIASIAGSTVNVALRGARQDKFVTPQGQTTIINATAAVFTAATVGSAIRFNGGALLVTQYTSATEVAGVIVQPLQGLAPPHQGAWSCTAPLNLAVAHPLVAGAGDPINVYADGIDTGTQTPGAAGPVATGTFNTIGLPYDTSYVSQPFEPQKAAAISAQGEIKSVAEMYLRVSESGPFQFGRRMWDDLTQTAYDEPPGLEQSEAPPDPQGITIMGWAPPLLTGIQRLNPQGGDDREGQLVISQLNGYPLTVVALKATAEIAAIPGPGPS